MVGFVDDSTGTCNDFHPQTEAPIQDLLKLMEADAQLWSDLLFCSGGKLELQKCSFHVLQFQIKPNGSPSPCLDTYDNQIKVTDMETNQLVHIPSKRAFDPHKTLGHFKSPYSKQTTALKIIQEKACRLSLMIGVSPLTRKGSYLAYHTVYIPSIQYTLPQSFFTLRDLDKAQTGSMQRIIAKCGYNRHTSRALLFAPLRYAGGGFLPWYMLQGEGQIKHFLKHWRTDTIISKTLRITLLWAQWQSGHHHAILEDPNTPLPHLECRWLTSLRNFLAHIHAQIRVDLHTVASPERRNDLYIMKYARECGLFTDQDLKIINYCRLYLHVTTVSELFDPAGCTLIPELFTCQREPWFNPSTVISLQRRPSDYQIRTKWQKLLRQWATSTGSLAASMDLGEWTVSGQRLRRYRRTYVSPTDYTRMYHWNDNCYWEYFQDAHQTMKYVPTRATNWRPSIESCIPINVIIHQDGTLTRLQRNIADATTRPQCRPPTTFQAYIAALPEWERHLLQGVTLFLRPYELTHQIAQLPTTGHLLAVSDGSLRGATITYGWVFGTDEGIIFAEHSGGGTGTPTSHRAEAWGMLSVCLFVHHLYQYTGNPATSPSTAPPLTFLSDNNGLVTRVTQRRQYDVPHPNATLAADWDLVEQITQVFQQLPQFDIDIGWVKGHQDDENPEITVEARYNIRADALAGQFSDHVPDIASSCTIVPAERCTLMVNQIPVHGHYGQSIRTAYTLPALYRYLEQRYGWTEQQREQVDWHIFQRAASNSPTSPIQLLKLVHDKLPTNSELAKSNSLQSSTCHFCTERETFYHLCKCANPIADKFRQEILAATDQYLDARNTPELFHIAFQHSLRLSLDIPTTAEKFSASQTAMKCVLLQNSLGRRSLLQGFWTSEWHKLYNQTISYYSLETPADGVEFLAGLTKIVWQEQLTLWDNHLQGINPSTATNIARQPDKVNQYKTRIRFLHAQREMCQHGHREVYFYADVEEFLATATGTQMRAYLHHYEPAINASILAARLQPVRSIFTFPGFRRAEPTTPPTRARHPRLPISNSTAPNSDAPRGTPLHRKHTRWRSISSSVTSIRKFFLSPSA